MSGTGCAVVHSGTVVHPAPGRGDGGDVVICGGIVRSACPHDPVPVDADGLLVTPGLVDIHVHGAAGHDLTEPEPAAWRQVLDTHLSAGTTTVLATLASTSPQRTAAALATAAALISRRHAPTLAGVHLEGPCLAPEQRGAHDPAHLRTPRQLLGELTPLPPALRMVTLAPELPGADALITHLVHGGVRVSAGHSAATGEDLAEAHWLGLSHLAHLWSGQSTLTRPALHRVPGLLEYSLASDEVTAEVIADGHHLPATLLTIALRCLGPERLCLVSDATAGMGLAPGATFRTGASRGRVHDGYAATTDHTSLCGGVTPLAAGVARMRELTGAPVEDVLTMATATPARAAGLYPRKGSLLPGADGDVVLFSPDLSVRAVVLGGRLITSADAEPVR
ncbi:N-acetylglucosamine-6-phosphate deacetylase [Streptomyces graminilatus]|uniref:N-acetylglucosamine-6-phosphate deacetylase n=1 Tax=Streptomyces graminilatus TaxID=1464070 RepID=UPI0006E39C1A|nr:amidohydrolase family protein [Streptomyces graminilatus]